MHTQSVSLSNNYSFMDEKDIIKQEKIERNMVTSLNVNKLFKDMHNQEISQLNEKLKNFKVMTKK